MRAPRRQWCRAVVSGPANAVGSHPDSVTRSADSLVVARVGVLAPFTVGAHS